MRMFRVLVICMSLPLWCAAVQPYTPVIADPVLEPWRWRHEEALEGLGVLCADEAPDGTLWFGTVGGIAHYDGSQVTRIPFDDALLSMISRERGIPWAKALLILPDGNLLVLIDGSLVLRADNKWKVIIQNTGASVFTARMAKSFNGTIWLIVPEALWRISADLTETYKVMQASGSTGLESFCLGPGGDLWVIERTGELTSRLVHIPVVNGQPMPERREFPVPYNNDRVEAQIIADDNGMIWYVNSSGQSGLNAFDSRRGEWAVRESAVPFQAYYSIMKSRDGSVWAGTEGGLLRMSSDGIEQFYPREKIRLPRAPLSLFEAHDRRLWIIARGGYVYSVDLGGSEWITYTGLHFECEAPDGTQWFCMRGTRVVSHDPRTGEWRQYSFKDGLIDSIDTLIRSSQGLIWIAGTHEKRAALAVFDGLRWTRFLHPEFARWIETKAVFEAADGTVWFGAGGRHLDVPQAGGALQYAAEKNGG
ncbi:MAG: hypothetical protein MUC65_06800, partial [Pontiellaceae bacterium]|nr:hypothetical protein [Pontiellaceae bacterium]